MRYTHDFHKLWIVENEYETANSDYKPIMRFDEEFEVHGALNPSTLDSCNERKQYSQSMLS